MINFRFHIISLVAVFLALALGIFLGSAVGEPTIVNRLRGEIDRADQRVDEAEADNDQLRRENDLLQAFIDDTARFTVEDRLESVDAVMIAERGIDEGVVESAMEMLRAAAANAPMVVWLEPDWQLTELDEIDRMRTALDSTTTDPEALRRDAFTALASRVTSPINDPTPDSPDLLQELVDANFVTIDGLDVEDLATFPIRRARAVVVDGAEGDIDSPTVFSQCVTAFATEGAGTVAAEVTNSTDPDAPGRGASIAVIRGDDSLEGQVSTIDNLDFTEGRIATVLALQEIANGVVGDYGYGRGASRTVPEPQAP
jgi:hypothetical protein